MVTEGAIASEIPRPIPESSGLASDQEFFLAFSPEREDPGNSRFHTSAIPKIVGADSELARNLAIAFYAIIVDRVVPLSSSALAEAVKITENSFEQ